MEEISKISVKHFLNKNITRTSEKGTKKYPVYVKVTFQRKSTEIKSFVFFTSMTEYEFKTTPQHKFNQEVEMIQYFVKKGFLEQGDSFTVKGISEICKEYNKRMIRDIFKNYVLNDFDIYLNTQITKDLFVPIVLLRHEHAPVTLYYMTALKLLTDKKGLMQFEDRFEIVKLIDLIKIPGYGHLSAIDFFNWQFGDVKPQFIHEAKTVYELEESTISKIISVIDNGIDQLV